MSELKPCPFCGGEPKVYTTSHSYNNKEWGDVWRIECDKCKCGFVRDFKTNVYRANNGDLVISNDGRKEAIDLWNRRYENET